MKSIKIIASGKYIPKKQITNMILANKFNVTEDYIYKRSGIETRFFVENEEIEELAIAATENLLCKNKKYIENIDMIIVATTSSNKIMPGISFLVQKHLKIEKCICFDIFAGCSGYINAMDIARNYIAVGKCNKVLVIGVEVLSKYIQSDDMSTSILLADGAGATLIEKTSENKLYHSEIESNGMNGDILTCTSDTKIHMDGKKIYKYAITKTVDNINKLLENAKIKMEDIKYIIPHQSNIKIIKAIATRLGVSENKMYINIKNVGNTFCASIPIALSEMYEKNILKEGDKIILLGYGGGLNLGSILLEV